MTRTRLLTLTALAALAALAPAACGVKPKELKAPQGADPAAYPKTYPQER